MDAPANPPPTAQTIEGMLVLLAFGVTLAVWIGIGRRLAARQPLVPYQPRRRVPWDWRDVVAIFGVYVLSLIAMNGLAKTLLDLTPQRNPLPPVTIQPALPEARSEEIRQAHPIVKLLHERHDLGTLLLAIATGVVVAPITEEFFFRLVLQGWLEGVEGRARRLVRFLQLLAPGVLPVAISSILFASLHYRTPTAPPPARELVFLLAANMLGSIVGLVFGLGWLTAFRGATAADLGFDRATWKSDIGTGLLAFAAVAVPVYLLQAGLTWLLPEIVPDPITMFFFASALGFLYYRTHRLPSSISLHMALNGTSLLVAWLTVGG